MNVRRLRKSQAKCWKYTTPSQFADKIEKQFRVFTGLKEGPAMALEGISTIELMLSNNVSDFISTETGKMLK
jgi:hypothetical protein